MKKYLSGILAIALAIGFSAFSNEKPKTGENFDTYRYFKVNPGHRTQTTFINSQVTYETSATSVPTNICLQTEDYKCLVGFPINQVTANPPYQLLDDGGDEPQAPSASAGMRWRVDNTSAN